MGESRGFALLAVLWLTVALSALVGVAVAHARDGESALAGQADFIRARWAAEGCLAAARARLAAGRQGAVEDALPDTIAFANGTTCVLDVIDPGTRLHLDRVPPAMRARFELLVRSDERAGLVTQDGDGRVNLNTAPAEVLRVLPGFDENVVQEVLEQRRWQARIGSLHAVVGRLPPNQQDAIYSHWTELLGLVSFASPSLVLRAEAMVAGGRPSAVIEEAVVLSPRPAVLSRRLW